MEKRPAANAAPSFTDEDDKVTGKQASRTVDETAKAGSSIGDPVAATDTNNDPLLYRLVDYDDPTTYRVMLMVSGDFVNADGAPEPVD